MSVPVWSTKTELRGERILRAHLCGPGDECEDPGAHFKGTDEQWAAIVRETRERQARGRAMAQAFGIVAEWAYRR